MSDKPSYYAILTASVRYDNRLTDSEKLMYAEVTALSNKYGYCTASNGYFSRIYEVSKVTISRRINQLVKFGYFNIQMEYEGKQIKQRRIYPINSIDNTPIIKSDNTPINRNDKENNTSINNINNNNSATDVASDPLEKEFEEWYEVYNKKKDKKAALTKFKAARKKHSYEQIMNGTKAYLKTVTDKQYQKYPKTFLHNETYLEDFTEGIKEKSLTDNWFDEITKGDDDFEL